MSDDWQVPDDLADRIRRLDRTDAWAREIERTAEVRAILVDLIAELVGHEMTPDGEACAVCSAIDRAEARLREADGDERTPTTTTPTITP